MEKEEQATKAAASFKIQSMVEHAMLLHGEPPSSLQDMRASSVSETVLSFTSSLHSSVKKPKTTVKAIQGTTNQALLNFHRMQDAREETGGVIWTLKKTFNGSLFSQEGVYLHGRLLAVNVVQFFVAAVMVALFVFTFELMDDFIGTKDDGCDVRVGKDGVDFPNYGDQWNTTVDGFKNIFNINETHWTLDGITAYEGNLPKFDGSEWDLEDVTGAKICFEIDNVHFFMNATGEVYVNFEANMNSFVEAIGIKQYE